MPDNTRFRVTRLGFTEDLLPTAREFRAAARLVSSINCIYEFARTDAMVDDCPLCKRFPELEAALNSIADVLKPTRQIAHCIDGLHDLIDLAVKRIPSSERLGSPDWDLTNRYEKMSAVREQIRDSVMTGPALISLELDQGEVLKFLKRFLDTMSETREKLVSSVEELHGELDRIASTMPTSNETAIKLFESSVAIAISHGKLAITDLKLFLACEPRRSVSLPPTTLKQLSRVFEDAKSRPTKLSCPPHKDVWIYKNIVYEPTGKGTEEQIRLLILADTQSEEEQWQSLRRRYGSDAETREPSRTAIPEDVRHEVWRRDGGKCVKCGSRERLEFDHIIPLSKGGNNTARNIELLCESCNRAKGDDLS